ncbi:MAG: hypothetical protein OXI90_04095 [Gammaproteobacteria bacterium]|nr:hypothetical protein [Gammaproteobacteria bacterium]
MAVLLDRVRSDAATLLESVDVSRVVVVDDEYADGVERLIGICSVAKNSEAAELPNLARIEFGAPYQIWSAHVRSAWEVMDREAQRELLSAAFRLEQGSGGSSDDPELLETEHAGDDLAADSLQQVLGSIGESCEFVTLSLSAWEDKGATILADNKAPKTLFFFDRRYGDERAGTDEKGIELIRQAQAGGARYCGLITHTVPVDGEYEAWRSMAGEHGLERNGFVVVSKSRLNSEPPDYYGFLAMMRVTALAARYAEVRTMAWNIFEQSLDEAKSAMEDLSVVDFDRIVFASSRREGVWEADTLFRVFGILMRRAAARQLHADEAVSRAVAKARRVSAMPDEVAGALGKQGQSAAALRMQRYEIYDACDELNARHAPLGLGDIFRVEAEGSDYILLAQPCDLVVRSRGLRNREKNRLGRTVAVVEIAPGDPKGGAVWGELPFYEDETADSAYANYGSTHQVLLAVLDLCVLQASGRAAIDVETECPDLLIEGWKKRARKLRNHFRKALKLNRHLAEVEVGSEAASLALPEASSTLRIGKAESGDGVSYGIRRVMRLRQPWSGALLTEFAQYQARAAFEHDFGYPVDPTLE